MPANDVETNDRAKGGGNYSPCSKEPSSHRGIAVNQAMALSQIISLILQSPNHRHFSISDLEWMVMPPLRLGQLAMAEAKPDQSGSRRPLAAMFWASVSSEIDLRLSSNLDAPMRLRPDEWRSGDILWIADMIGDMSTGHELVKNVMDTILAGRKVKVRSIDGAGKPVLLEISASSVTVVATSGSDACSHSLSCPPSGTVCASCITTGCTGRCRRGKSEVGSAVSH